jgi:hypothetical protein
MVTAPAVVLAGLPLRRRRLRASKCGPPSPRARVDPILLEALVLIACWSTKGGAGTTVVSASLALLFARSSSSGAAIADLGGDIPAALGLAPSEGPGLAGWLRVHPDVPADALARLEEPAGPALGLLRRGRGALPPGGADALTALLATDPRPVVADCGRLDSDGESTGAARVVASGADRSFLVIRPCFLALSRAKDAPIRPSGVVLVAEERRAITAADVEDALGVPVLARVRVTDTIARAVDAGLLAAHLPRTLVSDLRHAA